MKKIQWNELYNKSAFICVHLRLIKSNEILGYNPKVNSRRPARVNLTAKFAKNAKRSTPPELGCKCTTLATQNTDDTDRTDFHGYHKI